jgi:hypothetical protein
MGIPPDDYPVAQTGMLNAGTTGFDRQSGGDHIRSAEIRASAGEDVTAIHVVVIPPKGKPHVPLKGIRFGLVNVGEPQIVVDIQTADASPISDGYRCQFSFLSTPRRPPK